VIVSTLTHNRDLIKKDIHTMIPRLHELESVNFMIRENHQRALRDHQARLLHNLSPKGSRTASLTRPVTAFIERVRKTRVLIPRRVPHAG
jgi:hypothetical protein